MKLMEQFYLVWNLGKMPPAMWLSVVKVVWKRLFFKGPFSVYSIPSIRGFLDNFLKKSALHILFDPYWEDISLSLGFGEKAFFL